MEFSSDTKTPIFHPYPNFDVNQLSDDEETKIISAFGVRGENYFGIFFNFFKLLNKIFKYEKVQGDPTEL